MTAAAAAVLAAYGVHLAWTGLVLRWEGLGPGPRRPRPPRPATAATWLAQAGLGGVAPREFGAVVAALFVVGATLGWAVFGGSVAPVAVGLFAATFPVAGHRTRRRARRAAAQEAWPRLIEELRILTGALGRSIPQALFEVGARAPDELRDGFEAAHREWVLSTDFARALATLQAALADPTADATCETLLVAHEIGGTDLDARLEALATDRAQDVQGRKDAQAQQAGVRFARRFVLVVPLGMAAAGMTVGNGRAAYEEPTGQVAILIGLALVAACWWWAGRIMRIPDEPRVFGS